MSSEYDTTGSMLRCKFALLSLIVLVALAAVAGATQQSANALVCGDVQADVQGPDGDNSTAVDPDELGPNEGPQGETCVEPDEQNNDNDGDN